MLALALVVIATLMGTQQHMGYNVNPGALYFNPSSTGGQVVQFDNKGNPSPVGAPVGGGTQLGDSTYRAPGPTPEQQAAAKAASQAATDKADTLSFLGDQGNQLRGLLARTNTNLNQGLTQNQDQYDTALGGANLNKQNQVTSQNQAKLSSYNSINQNAGNAYRSLAQIIGRASGTGSSAFRDLLPNAIGKDTSSQRSAATDTYGQNLSGIDNSYNATVADLLKQKKTNEDTLRSGIEGRRQTLNQQLSDNAGKYAQANGGGYAAIKASQAPFQSAIDNSRNAVEGFFNQFRTPYAAIAQNPNLAAYSQDRSTVNAQNQGAEDANNPYASLLRKKLQQGTT